MENLSPKQNSSSLGRSNDFKKLSSRWHCLTCYIPIEVIHNYLKNAFWVKHWSIVLHDKDVYDSDVLDDQGQVKFAKGSLKVEHTHILLYCKDVKTSSAVVKRFDNLAYQYALDNGGLVQNTLGQVCFEPMTQYRYQLHLDDPDKFLYPSTARIVDSVSYWKDFSLAHGVEENKALAIFDDIQNGVAIRDMLVKYGCTYAHNYKKYHNLVDWCNFLQIKQDIRCVDADNLFSLLGAIVSQPLLNSPFTDDQIQAFWSILQFVDFELSKTDLQLDIVVRKE